MALATPVSLADTHVHRLFAVHAGMPVGVVTQCAANHAPLLHAAWHAEPGRSWGENARALFEQCDDYVFELLHDASTRKRRLQDYDAEHVWPQLVAAGPRVLDFGGGLGLASSLLADAGKTVTYCDVDGPAARFAAWFFARTGQRIELLRTSAAGPALPSGRQWDVVLAEHVLEHVEDPVAVAGALAAVVAPEGLLHVVVDTGAHTLRPHAREVDVDALLAGSPALRAMSRLPSAAAGHLLLRAR
jgi:SAM-dependent methyltransferase